MVRNLYCNKNKLVVNFVLLHPEFLPVVKRLAESGNEWLRPKELKEEAGIGTRNSGEDYGNWLSFSNKCRDCGLTEVMYDKNRHTMIRVAPGKNSELMKVFTEAAA